MWSWYDVGWAALLALVVVVLMSPTGSASAEEITIAAASDLNFAFKEHVSTYEKLCIHQMKLTLGSCGNFFSQIQNGAPFDLYFSADIEYPRKLAAAGLAEPGTLYEYAIGRIVIWMPPDSNVDIAKQGWNALLDARVK